MTPTKRRVGSVAVTLAVVAAFVLHASPASAYATYHDHKLRAGVGNYGYNNQYYYVDSSASAQLNTTIEAMNDWIYTTQRLGITTPISFVRTTNRAASVMDTYRLSYVMPCCWAITSHYNGQVSQDPDLDNWYWGKIDLSNDYANCPNQKGVIAHEMGHVMGLAHVEGAKSLMYRLIARTSVRAAVADDLNGINHLY